MSFRGGHLVRRFMAVSGMAALLLTSLAPPAAAAVTLQVKAGGFNRPLYVTHAGDSRLFVVEQGGLIRIINGDGSVRTRPFLNISTAVACCGEQGLLGLAFHPGYATNRLFYVNFTRKSDGATVVAEFRRSPNDVNLADPRSFRPVLVIPQPYKNHNGGWIGFRSGKLLFIATGDGGGADDPANNAQNLGSLLGKILRINPLDPDGSGPRRYKIPPRNPFVGRAGRDEIWAYGLRNPWRCSFDRGTGKLWCADVGQSRWEEINRAKGTKGGLNYGWRVMEGRECYNATTCNTAGKKLPIAVYSHSSGCSVTGGYVARRSGAALHGRYIFGDYCSGNIWTISATHPSGARLPAPTDTSRFISSFGEGRDGRIYLTDISNGVVYYVRGT